MGATHSIFDGLVDEVRISDIARYDADYDVPKTAFVPDDNTLYLLHLDEDDIDGDNIKNFGKMGPSTIKIEYLQTPTNIWLPIPRSC